MTMQNIYSWFVGRKKLNNNMDNVEECCTRPGENGKKISGSQKVFKTNGGCNKIESQILSQTLIDKGCRSVLHTEDPNIDSDVMSTSKNSIDCLPTPKVKENLLEKTMGSPDSQISSKTVSQFSYNDASSAAKDQEYLRSLEKVSGTVFAKPLMNLPRYGNLPNLSVSDNESICSTPSPDTSFSSYEFKSMDFRNKRQKISRYSIDEVLIGISDKIPKLLNTNDFTSDILSDLKYIKRRTSYSPDHLFRTKTAEKLYDLRLVDLFIKIWRSVHNEGNHMHPSNASLQNILQIVITLWNTTDVSISLCNEFLTKATPLALTDLRSGDFDIEKLVMEDKLYYVKAILGILHNICRLMDADAREELRKLDAVIILQTLLPITNLVTKTKVLLILSYIIDEHENEIINADNQNIEFFIQILESALMADNHFSREYGFSSTEIVAGLNQLAENDTNKTRIVANNALPLYVKLMSDDCSSDEQRLAARGLWILAFNESCKKEIKKQEGCMQALHCLWKMHIDESVRHAAQGAVWEVNVSRHQISRVPSTVNVSMSAHIMISYQWDSKQTMIHVKDRLKLADYNVWMDVEHMSGSTLEAMALAVERASVIIICMSQRYKDSPSCRSEAEYAFRLRKDVIPLRLQEDYDPDGWLGMIIGTKLYFDFSNNDIFDASITGLVKELGERGKVMDTPDSDKQMFANQLFSIDKNMKEFETVESWNELDVQIWLQKNDLKHVCHKFDDYNGELLIEMKRMHRDCPAFLYESLQKEFGFKLKDTLSMSAALVRLPIG